MARTPEGRLCFRAKRTLSTGRMATVASLTFAGPHLNEFLCGMFRGGLPSVFTTPEGCWSIRADMEGGAVVISGAPSISTPAEFAFYLSPAQMEDALGGPVRLRNADFARPPARAPDVQPGARPRRRVIILGGG